MSLRYVEDMAVLQQSMPTGLEGVKGLEKFIKDATPEVQNLLRNECDVIIECRYCRNMFRSLVNFISHKRTFCRGLHQAAMANTAAVAIMKKAEEKSEKGDVKEKEPKKHAKNPANLKRTNIVGALNKRIVNVEIPIPGHTDMLDLHTLPRISKEVPVTILENGVHKIVGEIPTTLAQKESLPDDRVILLMPQDHSSKYREMQLRNRRDTGSKQDVVREISGVEIQCLERFAKFAPTLTDSGNCQCLHSSCTHIRSFGSIQALAFHVSMKHSKRVGPNNNIPCLLCNRQLKTWSSFQQHVNRVHKHVKAEHNQFRSEENDASGKKKTLKGKNVNGSPRTRSLSPDYTGSDLDEREDDEEEVPPALPQQPALESSHKDEAEGDDGQVDDEPPQLIMMTRGRREIKVPKKYRDGEEIITRSASKANESPKSISNKPTPNVSREPSEDVEKLVKKDVIEEKFDQDKVVVKKEDNSLNDIEDNNFCSDIQFVVRSLVNNTALDETISTSWNAHSRDVSLAPSISVSESGETPADGHKLSKNAVTNKKSAPKIEKKSISSKFLTDRSLKKRSNSHDDTSISTQVSAVIVRKAVKNVKVAIASLSKQDDSDSSDTLENIRSKRLRGKVGSDANESASEQEDEEEEPVTRPSRNRKRPDWMDKEDYVIESNKKQRRDEDTPVVINDDACTSAADTDVVTENASLVARGFRPGFVIPRRKKITDSMDQSGKKSESRSSSTGPPTLMASDFVLPESRPTASTPKKNMMLDAFDMSSFTPRARRMLVQERMIAAGQSQDSPTTTSRRKQNLNGLGDESADDVTIVSANGRLGKPDDLAMVPVYLSEAQKELFFSSLKLQDPRNPNGPYRCAQCEIEVPNLREGRRHMVTHIRVMRLRCSLCGAGSFFCTDLRAHLMDRCCDKLHLAPEGVVRPEIPCMTREQADHLSELVDPVNPGRVMYTSGQIVSAFSKRPYFPDPVIEERILGPGRLLGHSSPVRGKHVIKRPTI